MPFVSDLSHTDLVRLRQVVKRVHMQYHPPESYTDAEADKIIEAFGPEICERLLKRALDRKFLA